MEIVVYKNQILSKIVQVCFNKFSHLHTKLTS